MGIVISIVVKVMLSLGRNYIFGKDIGFGGRASLDYLGVACP